MNPRATLWLLVATALLAAFVWFYEIRGEPARRAAEEARGRLFPEVAADAVEALRIQRPGEPASRLERGASGWRLVEPLAFPADAPAVSAMLRTLAETPSAGRIDDPAAPGVYGLADAAILVSFTAGGRAHALRIGRETPVGRNLYVRVIDGADDADPAGALQMAPSAQLAAFDRSAEDLRDRRVLDFAPADADRIELSGPGLAAVLEREDDGWTIALPARLPADGGAVERLLSDLSLLRADSFLDEPGPEELRALEAAGGTRIEISGEDLSASLRLSAGDPSGADTRLAEGREGHRYRVRAALVAHLPDRLFALREKRVARFDPAEATSVELAFGGGASAAFARAGADGGWSDAEGRIAGAGLSDLLEALSRLDAVGVVAESAGPRELGALGLDPPELTIGVRGEAGELALLHLGRRDDSGVLARTRDGGAVLRLAPAFAERLPRDASGYLEEPAAEDPAAP